MKFILIVCVIILQLLALSAAGEVVGSDANTVVTTDTETVQDPVFEDLPDPRMPKNLTTDQLALLKKECGYIKDMYEIVKERRGKNPEGALVGYLSDFVSKFEQDLHNVHKKYHHEVDCEIAHSVMKDSTAETYLNAFKKVVSGHTEGHAATDIHAKLTGLLDFYKNKLKLDLHSSRLEHIEDIIGLQANLAKIGPKLEEYYSQLMAEKDDATCRAKLNTFMTATHDDIRPDQHTPRWFDLEEDLVSLVTACDGPPPTPESSEGDL